MAELESEPCGASNFVLPKNNCFLTCNTFNVCVCVCVCVCVIYECVGLLISFICSIANMEPIF